MHIGVAGLLPSSLSEINAPSAIHIRELGFTGASLHLDDVDDASEVEAARVRNILENAGLRLAQLAVRNDDLVSADDSERRSGVRTMQRACRVTRWLDAANLYVRPGSLNPVGPWTPHPINTHQSTILRLVDSLVEIASAAESEGVKLALEGHIVSPLNTPERIREVVEAVDSSNLGVNADPVNLVGDLGQLYGATDLVDRVFDELSAYVICAHAKDVRAGDRLVLHLDECTIGEGFMDQTRFLTRFNQCCPDGFVLIEHLPADRVKAAKQALDSALNLAGLSWED